MGVERHHFPVILGFMDGGIPALKRRMRLINSRLAGQLFTERAAFAGAVTVEQIPRLITLVRALAQTPEPPPLGGNRPDARPHNQRARGTSAQRDPVLSLPGIHRPLRALPNHAYAKQRQTGGDHPAPQAAFWTQGGFHNGLSRTFLDAGLLGQGRGKVIGLGTAERLCRFERLLRVLLKRSGKVNARF